MGRFLFLCLGLATAVCAAALPANRWDNDRELNMKMVNPIYAFEEWVEEHSLPYLRETEEWATRFATWLENLHKVIEYNKQGHSHWLTMNKFAAMTQEEFHHRYLGLRMDPNRRSLRTSKFSHADVDLSKIPEKMDWREKNAVTEVKNQKKCGSCWSFSTTGAIEGVNAIYSGELEVLSEQELLDCDTTKDHACDGGWMDYAFAWVIDNGGLTTEKDYPYLAKKGICNRNKLMHTLVSIDDYEDCPVGEEGLLKAASQQPVSVAINAEDFGFQLYGGGIFDSYCGTELNHGVLVVGYSMEPLNEYFLVKNSWGPEWGEHGYIKLALGKNGDDGQCGVTMAASYPIKTSPNPGPGPWPAPGPEPSPEPTPEPAPGPSPGPTPPTPPPGPQLPCDAFNECSQGETCCCILGLFGVCFQYGCCPFANAICCTDGVHCCPVETPVCNMSDMQCENADSSISIPMEEKRAANRVWPWTTSSPDQKPSHRFAKFDSDNSEVRRRLPVS